VPNCRDTQASRHCDSVILARVVGKNNVVDNVVWNFVDGLLERLGGVVGRQHYGNLFVREHQTSAEQPLLIVDYAEILIFVNNTFKKQR
jgi:hypothetical protein